MKQDDDYTRALIDRYVAVGPMLRVVGGDNRLIPIHVPYVPGLRAQPRASRPLDEEQRTGTEAAGRIAGIEGTPKPGTIRMEPTEAESPPKLCCGKQTKPTL